MILMEYGYGCENRSPATSRPPLCVTIAPVPIETVPNHVYHALWHAARKAAVAGKAQHCLFSSVMFISTVFRVTDTISTLP